MLDVCVIPLCMVGTRQWSRLETNVCWETRWLTRDNFCFESLLRPKAVQGQVSLSVGA